MTRKEQQVSRLAPTPTPVVAGQLPDIKRSMLEFVSNTRLVGEPDCDILTGLAPDVRAAEMFLVSSEFALLINAAHGSMPDHTLSPHDPPSPSGLTLNANPVALDSSEAFGRFDGFAGWIWSVRETGVVLGPIWETREGWCKYFPLVMELPFGVPFSKFEEYAPGAPFHASMLIAFWNILRQERVVEASDAEVPRSTRRRAARERMPEPNVRVITLRRARSEPKDETANSREWHHRWVVRGHWRRQWYASIEDHRPVWIAPHLKGPEDAPLLGGHKVYAARK